MKTWCEKGKGSFFANTARVFTTGRRAKLWKVRLLLPRPDVAVARPQNLLKGKRDNRCCLWAREESLDFVGSDTSERLGAERLRKVSQKTFRGASRQGEMLRFMIGAPPKETLGEINPIRSKTKVKR